MSGIEKRIEQVLMEHARRIDPNHPGYGNCRCGFSVDLPQDQAAHVAAALVQALDLSPEQRTLADGSGGMTIDTKTGVVTTHGKPCTRQSRGVTKWETL